MEVAIIGFGLSGIAACRWALHYGFKPTVFEKNASLGGVWLTHSYPNCKLQTTRYTYHFSDEKMPEEWGTYPSGDHVFEYLKNYVQKHDLEKCVRYTSAVDSIEKKNDMWQLVVNGKQHAFNYVIVATGFYGAANNKFPHCLLPNEINKPDEQFRNKNVVIIGNGPSGCDLACLAAENEAKSVRLLYRSPRWIFMRHLGGISLHFFTWRIFLTIAYYMPRSVLKMFLVLLYLVPLIVINSPYKIDFPDEKVNRKNLVLNDSLFQYIRQNMIEYIKDPVQSVEEGAVLTQSGGTFAYDLAIDARGYNTGIPLLNKSGDDGIPKLYRNIVRPDDASIAFIGFAATFSWMQASELQCHWYFQQALGRFQLPSAAAQQATIDSNTEEDYHDLAYLYYYYINVLRNDMGLPSISNWFSLPEQIIFKSEI